jgi:hypothetical protein
MINCRFAPTPFPLPQIWGRGIKHGQFGGGFAAPKLPRKPESPLLPLGEGG